MTIPMKENVHKGDALAIDPFDMRARKMRDDKDLFIGYATKNLLRGEYIQCEMTEEGKRNMQWAWMKFAGR